MFGSINGLEIANGLKELLASHGFTLDLILKTPPAEMALILGIDLYVARLIYLVAKRAVDARRESEIEYKLQSEMGAE
jgi:hypothetical protein